MKSAESSICKEECKLTSIAKTHYPDSDNISYAPYASGRVLTGSMEAT